MSINRESAPRYSYSGPIGAAGPRGAQSTDLPVYLRLFLSFYCHLLTCLFRQSSIVLSPSASLLIESGSVFLVCLARFHSGVEAEALRLDGTGAHLALEAIWGLEGWQAFGLNA